MITSILEQKSPFFDFILSPWFKTSWFVVQTVVVRGSKRRGWGIFPLSNPFSIHFLFHSGPQKTRTDSGDSLWENVVAQKHRGSWFNNYS